MPAVQCIVAYPARKPNGELARFNLEYYLTKHMPMIDEYWGPCGLKAWDVFEFPLQSPLSGKDVEYSVLATLEFDSLEGLKNALQSKETRADVAMYCDVQPCIWVSEKVGSKCL
ncbi:hypothetical protein ASPVEDRAFT_86880 [Aspergillus versicolor CBS 583.65]|uniref:EthD domain-containing protein n=1 Tax=Aspergillus versicolor CBS 583.65 TaxID=1036611 RepID=A0A1L9PVT7_ASPVE|nr:uncharacterized protein ASPVEDRAFT_86880 [Aspergillus versicolor CBS 583.65]OJJ05536.1 hypothetical protein ASPVEDRAFT_86880 [Aspergillus versicolor CBS 583.65]